MALARWSPFQEMTTLRDAMDRLFEQSFVRPSGAQTWTWRAGSVPMDVYADGDNYVIEVAVPGLNPDAVNVSVLGNQVTISGEYPALQGRQFLLRERAVGRFERTITIPSDFEADKIQAHYEHGLLRLTAPKAEAARPKRIALTAGR